MADHLREQILDAIVTDVTGLTTTASNVYRLRVFPESRANLPSLNVVMSSDSALNQQSGQVVLGFQDQHLIVRIEARVAANASIDQTLNLIDKEVSIALDAGTVVALSGVRRLWKLMSAEPEVDPDGETQLAVMGMFYGIDYRASIADPSVPG